MSDLTSRQAAISAICNACGKIDCDKMDKCEKLQLPPANGSETPNSSDCISRQAAIDAVIKHLQLDYEYAWGVREAINGLPAADVVPVVRCKECKFRENDDFCTGRGFPCQLVPDDGFCDKGERKERADGNNDAQLQNMVP